MEPTYRRPGWRRRGTADHPVPVRIRLFLAMVSVLALTVGITVVLYDQLDIGGDGGDQVVSGASGGPAPEDSEVQVVPRPGQVRVTGKVTSVLVAGAVLQPRELPTPLRVSSERGFGNGGEITRVEVEGQPSTIVWDGGTPLEISAGGALLLEPVSLILVDGGGLRAVIGSGNHAFTPGTYSLDTSVAVGSEGVATPRDNVTFEAVDGSLLEARGDASIMFDGDTPRRFVGPGTVLLAGTLEITDPDGTRTEENLVTQVAAYDLTFTPDGAGGWTVEGIVDQPTQPTLPAS